MTDGMTNSQMDMEKTIFFALMPSTGAGGGGGGGRVDFH